MAPSWKFGLALSIHISILFGYFSSSAACNAPWVPFGSSCYMFVQDKSNWFHAAHKCRLMDSKLVQINSADEETFLRQKITGMHASDDPQTIGYWTGANDLAVEGEWVWNYPSEMIVTYNDWFPGEPNNFWYDRREEDCVVLWGHDKHNYQWNDQPCDTLDYFVCEIPGNTNIIGKK